MTKTTDRQFFLNNGCYGGKGGLYKAKPKKKKKSGDGGLWKTTIRLVTEDLVIDRERGGCHLCPWKYFYSFWT